MANVLEGLVAKGRRVNHIREQREVAYGLADLSTHKELHQRIVKKGGVKTLIHLLTNSRDVEAQRFSALALANTSCAELLRVEIASQEDSLRHLTDYIKNTAGDLLGRQYCAMALGNLAADTDNHVAIVKVGAVEALVLLLKVSAEEEDQETGRYAAFALSNLATDANNRKRIVQEGAVSPLVAMACSDDITVQRHALNVLRGLCISVEYREVALESGILDPLILIARSDDFDILREVAAALNCLSSVPKNKLELADRAISTIITLMLSGDRVIERHACCTIANLVEMNENHPRFLDNDGLPSLISMLSSEDLQSKGEAARALANLSSNEAMQHHLVVDEILQGLVQALTKSEVNCQRYAALSLANLATTVSSQIHIVQAGAIEHLITLVKGKGVQLECRRYSCLAIANLSATVANHLIIFQMGGLNAMFSLSNSPDLVSQYYVACALANLSSNIENHSYMIEQGGIQPLVSLAYSPDPDVSRQATAALRGLSASDGIKMKLVQEGALEPLSRLLLSRDTGLSREVTSCLCNLSLGNENKIEIAKCGIIPPLVTMIQAEDIGISSFSTACLANLAEVPENQELIAAEGGIKPVLRVMRSHNIEMQREGGRLLANLSACSIAKVPEIIVENGGHKLLISYLLSRDLGLQRVGAFGVGNLCTHERHRVTLRKAGVLEPLATLIRSDSPKEIRRFAMLSIVNLSAEVANHESFVKERILQLLISLSSFSDSEIRQYAAVCIVNIATNMEMRNVVTDEGGLEPVLYLARTEDVEVRKRTLSALAVLSFVDRNKEDICHKGGLIPVIQEMTLTKEGTSQNKELKLACCTVANLTENIENIQTIVEANLIQHLTTALYLGSSDVRAEAARALGNISANLDYAEVIVSRKDFIQRTVSFLVTETAECQRMITMALANISCNSKLHHGMIRNNIIDILCNVFHGALDPKSKSDIEISQFSLILVANLSASNENHPFIMEKMIAFLTRFTRHRDVRCRQNAIIILGNLCSNPQNLEALEKVGALQLLISFSFPPMDSDATNAQFQSIAGVRGFGTNTRLRNELVRDGCMEPLILAAGNKGFLIKDIEVRREAAAAMYNLSLSSNNGLRMAQSGVVGALISLMATDDVIGQVYAVGTLANLAERENKVQSILINDGCLAPLIRHIENRAGNVQTRREIARCFALFAYNTISHQQLMCRRLLKSILDLATIENDLMCRRYCIHTFANLSIFEGNHSTLIEVGVVQSLNDLVIIDDIEAKRCISFAFHNIAKNHNTHRYCENLNLAKSIIVLLEVNDYFTQLHSCLTLKYLSVSVKAGAQFVESGGLRHLFLVAKNGDNEQKRESVTALKNLSISNRNKVLIIKDGGMELLTYLCRFLDHNICHQACGVLANLAESADNQELMMKEGILHHLKYIVRSKSNEILRESLRAIANLSSDISCSEVIPKDGVLRLLICSLSSNDNLCRSFATMALSNLATVSMNRNLLVQEGGIEPLLVIAADLDNSDISRKYAFGALTNLSASRAHHETLVACGIIALCYTYMESTDLELTSSALLCLSNLASNSCNHVALEQASCIQRLMPLLESSEREILLRAVTFFRGLSANMDFCDILLCEDLIQKLLNFAITQDTELQTDALATLCNLSFGGYISADPEQFVKRVDIRHLISFLCSSNATFRLFGAISIGNIASDVDMQSCILDKGSLNPLIHIANIADLETQRCIAYALCNLCRVESNRLAIVEEGGLIPIFSLAFSGDECDVLTAVSTIRGLSNTEAIRHSVVAHGGLEPLFNTLKKDRCIHCKNQAMAAIAALSLDEDNKKSMVKNVGFHQIKNLSILGDSNQTINSLRILANCAEHSALHSIVIENLFDFILGCDHLSNIHIAHEISRLYVNLSSNADLINTLVKNDVPEQIVKMLKIENDMVVRNSVISIHNLSVDGKHQQIIFSKGLVNLMIHHCLVPCSSKSFECLQIRRYTSIVLGNLVRSEYGFQNFFSMDLFRAFGDLLEDNDLETRFNATFGLHQFAAKYRDYMPRNDSLSELIANYGIETKLLKYIRSTSQNLLSHALSAIRHLSRKSSSSSNIVMNHGCEIISHTCKEVTSVEIRREIAATFCHLTVPSDNKLSVASSSAIKCIFDLLSSSDKEIVRFATGAMANLAEDQLTHDLLISEGIIQILIKKSYDKILSIRRESSRGLSNILTSEKAHKIYFEHDGLDSILTLSCAIDFECQYSASLSLHKLASYQQNHDFLIVSGIHHSILKLSKLQDNLAASYQALSALRELSSNRQHKVFIANEGGLQAARDLLLFDDLGIQTLAASTLQHLSVSGMLKQRFCVDGILDVIISRARDADDNVLLLHCVETLSNIFEHPKNQTSFWKFDMVDLFVKLSNFPSLEVQEKIARAINFTTSLPDLNQYDDALILKVMEVAIHLLSLSTLEYPSLQACAAAAVGNIAIDDKRQRLLCKLGVFKPLIALMNANKSSRLNSCRSISRLLVSYENKFICSENRKLIENLIHLVGDEGDIVRFSVISLCNLSLSEKAHKVIVENGGIRALLTLITNADPEVIVFSVRTLCNLGRNRGNHKQIVDEGGIIVLSSLLQHDDMSCVEIAALALSNLCADRKFNKAIISTGSCHVLAAIMNEKFVSEKQIAVAKIVFNLSTTEDCHVSLVKSPIVGAIKLLCKSKSASCRLSAIMTLSNISANNLTRSEAIRNGGLQAAVVMLKDSNDACKTNACICLTNMSINPTTQKQIVLHGGLPLLTQNLLRYDNPNLQRSSILCITNLASNLGNHDAILRQGTYHHLIETARSNVQESNEFYAFAICNLLSNDALLEHIGSCDGIPPLLTLGKSSCSHYQCIALTALRRLASSSQNRKRLMEFGVLKIIRKNGLLKHLQIKQEIAALLCNLSHDVKYMANIVESSLDVITYLISSDDSHTAAYAVGTLATIAEDHNYHSEINQHESLSHLLNLVLNSCCDVRREAVRAISNLLSSNENHVHLTKLNLSPLVELTGDDDNECQYNALLSCRKLVVNQHNHDVLMTKGLEIFFSLLKAEAHCVNLQAASILRDLCANEKNKEMIVAQGGIAKILILLKSEHTCLKSIGIACIRHLSCNDNLKRTIMLSNLLTLVLSCILGAEANLLSQIAGLLANLSEEVDNHVDMINEGVIPALLTLSRTGQMEIVQDVARTLANLSANEHKQLSIYQQGALSCLVHISLSSTEDSISRRYVSLAIQIISTNSGVCSAILKAKTIDSLLKLSSLPHLEYKRTATVVAREISSIENGKKELSKPAFLKIILQLCSVKDLQIQRNSASTLANIADCYDAHCNLVDVGAMQVIARLAEDCSDHFVVQEICRFFSFATIYNGAKDEICQLDLVQTLLRFSCRSDVLTQRHAVLALCNLCLSKRHKDFILHQRGTVSTLVYLMRCPDLEVNRCTILALSAVTLSANEATKKEIILAGAMKQVSKSLQYPDIEIQQCASLALSSLVLGDGDEVKHKVQTEHDVLDSILVLLNSSNEECVHHAVHIIGSLMEVYSICNYLVEKGCVRCIVKVFDFASIEIKRVCGYVFSLLVEQQQFHQVIEDAGGLEKIVDLSALVDSECQLYGAFSLVFLASNQDFQVRLVQLGAVRSLVAMMANESEPRHYAGLALLKLADNFENHISIAEEGGIQALLKLGRSRAADEEVQYKAALTVGNLASKAADASKISSNY